jgi:hypothetical protein
MTIPPCRRFPGTRDSHPIQAPDTSPILLNPMPVKAVPETLLPASHSGRESSAVWTGSDGLARIIP